jgi:hypothetical protein
MLLHEPQYSLLLVVSTHVPLQGDSPAAQLVPPVLVAPPVLVVPPALVVPPELVVPPTMVTPPVLVAPPALVTPLVLVAPPELDSPPVLLAPPELVSPPALVAPPKLVSPPALVAPPALVVPPVLAVPPVPVIPPVPVGFRSWAASTSKGISGVESCGTAAVPSCEPKSAGEALDPSKLVAGPSAPLSLESEDCWQLLSLQHTPADEFELPFTQR